MVALTGKRHLHEERNFPGKPVENHWNEWSDTASKKKENEKNHSENCINKKFINSNRKHLKEKLMQISMFSIFNVFDTKGASKVTPHRALP